MEHWHEKITLKKALTLRAVDVRPGGEGLIGGHVENKQLEPTQRLLSRQARVLSIRDASVTETFSDTGSVSVLDQYGSTAFGVLVRTKPSGFFSAYWLIRSTDEGANWEAPQRMDTFSVQQLVALTDVDVWVLGARDTLVYSRDAGRSWRPVELPGRRNTTQERLVRLNNDHGALLGRGMLAIDSNGVWSVLVDSTYLVYAAAGEYVAVSDETRQFVARRSPTGLQQLIDIPRDRLPLQLITSESIVRLVTRAANPKPGGGIDVWRSEDSGRTWTTTELPVTPLIDIAGAEAGMAIALLNAVVASP